MEGESAINGESAMEGDIAMEIEDGEAANFRVSSNKRWGKALRRSSSLSTSDKGERDGRKQQAKATGQGEGGGDRQG